jgi:ATP-dependent DNA helicase RecQ
MVIAGDQVRAGLEKYFGYGEFRPGQEEVINSILSGSDTLAVMPTGGGKSLCYQLPAILMKGTAIVISPLIALMKDQVDALEKNNIPSTFINSSLDWDELKIRLERAERGQYKLLYIAPERLESNRFLEMIRNLNISFLAIDEAHCISEWGHDFRPAYTNITKIFDYIPQITIGAYTATATPDVQADIVKVLKLKEAKKFIKGFDRPNLTFITEEIKDRHKRVLEIIKGIKDGSAIVYCASRAKVEETADYLKKYKIKALPYHAGMKDEYRKFVQEQFISGKINAIVATVAFGMGIDKANVRAVIHANLPGTIEGYYQEAGRAGRDGKPSKCYLLHHSTDTRIQEFLIDISMPLKDDIVAVYNAIYDVNSIGIGSRSSDPIYLSPIEIANLAKIKDSKAEAILKLLETKSIIRRNNAYSLGTIEITVNKARIAEYFSNTRDERNEVLEAILRSVSAEVYSRPVDFDLNYAVRKYNIDKDTFEKNIRALELAGLIKYQQPGATGGITLIAERMMTDSLPFDFESFERRKANAYKKLDVVLRYARTIDCKRNFILNYFGEDDVTDKCGRCTSCLRRSNDKYTGEEVVSQEPTGKAANEEEIIDKILFAVASYNERYGKVLFCEVLKGKKSIKIERNRLNKSSYFGACKNDAPQAILNAMNTAIKNGYLAQSGGLRPLVFITPKGKSRMEYSGEKAPQKAVAPVQKKDENKVFSDVYKNLQLLREEIARKKGIPPNAVVSDGSLFLISNEMPGTLDKLYQICTNRFFVANYGKQVIAIVRGDTAAVKAEIGDNYSQIAEPSPISDEVARIVELVKKDYTLQSIAFTLKLMPGDVARHIQTAIENGAIVNKGCLVADDVYRDVKKIMQTQKNMLLKDVNDKMGNKIDLPSLRIAMALAREEMKKR